MAESERVGTDSDEHILESSIESTRAPVGAAPHEIVVFCLILLGIALAASAATLTTYPTIHTDEPWYANLAWNWLTTGNRWTTLDVGPFPDGRGQGTTLLGALPIRLAVQLGGLSLAVIRLPSLVAGVLLLAVVAATGRLLWAWPSGLLAALALALQPLLLGSSHVARPEIWLALSVQAALACTILGWRQHQPLWDVAAAGLTAVCVEIHQNGAAFAVGLAAGYLALYGLKSFRQRNVLAFFATVLVGALGYVLRRGAIIPAGLIQAGSAAGTATSHAIPLFSSSPVVWIAKEAVRYVYYVAHSQLGGLLVILAVLAAVRRRTQVDRLLLVWMLGSAGGMMVLVSRLYALYYVLPIVAVGSLLVGRLAADLLERPGAWATHTVAITSMVLMIPLLFVVGKPGVAPPEELHQDLREAVPCERVLGPNQYWLAFSGCDYRSVDVLNHYHHRQGLSLEEAVAAVGPDYLIVDETVAQKLQEDFGTVRGMAGHHMLSYYGLPETAFERFLDDHTTVERLLFEPGYGTIQIRRVRWEDGS